MTAQTTADFDGALAGLRKEVERLALAGDPEGVFLAAQRFLGDHADEPRAVEHAAGAMVRAGRWAGKERWIARAIALFEARAAALRAKPEADPDALAQTLDAFGEALLELARLIRTGTANPQAAEALELRALDVLEEAVVRIRHVDVARRAVVLCRAGSLLAGRGRHYDAIDRWRAALEEFPNHPWAGTASALEVARAAVTGLRPFEPHDLYDAWRTLEHADVRDFAADEELTTPSAAELSMARESLEGTISARTSLSLDAFVQRMVAWEQRQRTTAPVPERVERWRKSGLLLSPVVYPWPRSPAHLRDDAVLPLLPHDEPRSVALQVFFDTLKQDYVTARFWYDSAAYPSAAVSEAVAPVVFAEAGEGRDYGLIPGLYLGVVRQAAAVLDKVAGAVSILLELGLDPRRLTLPALFDERTLQPPVRGAVTGRIEPGSPEYNAAVAALHHIARQPKKTGGETAFVHPGLAAASQPVLMQRFYPDRDAAPTPGVVRTADLKTLSAGALRLARSAILHLIDAIEIEERRRDPAGPARPKRTALMRAGVSDGLHAMASDVQSVDAGPRGGRAGGGLADF